MKNRFILIAATALVLGWGSVVNANVLKGTEVVQVRAADVADTATSPVDFFELGVKDSSNLNIAWGWPHRSCVFYTAVFGLAGGLATCGASPVN